MSTKMRFPVHLEEKSGNSFIILEQGAEVDEEGRADHTHFGLWSWRLVIGLEAADPEMIDLVVGDNGEMEFPHLKSAIHTPRLMHGGADVYIIAGPDFDVAYADHLKGVAEPALSE